MNLLLPALLLSLGARADDGHRPGSIDRVTTQTGRTGLIGLAEDAKAPSLVNAVRL